MSAALPQCMGGFCTCREKCAHYWAPKQRNVPPAERLCMNGADGDAMSLRPVELQPKQPHEVGA